MQITDHVQIHGFEDANVLTLMRTRASIMDVKVCNSASAIAGNIPVVQLILNEITLLSI